MCKKRKKNKHSPPKNNTSLTPHFTLIIIYKCRNLKSKPCHTNILITSTKISSSVSIRGLKMYRTMSLKCVISSLRPLKCVLIFYQSLLLEFIFFKKNIFLLNFTLSFIVIFFRTVRHFILLIFSMRLITILLLLFCHNTMHEQRSIVVHMFIYSGVLYGFHKYSNRIII